MREFHEKYETIEEDLSPLQRKIMEEEYPHKAMDICIDGQYIEDELEIIKKAYSYILEDEDCFACQRFCMSYPKTIFKNKNYYVYYIYIK